jgi:hypothetical protein
VAPATLANATATDVKYTATGSIGTTYDVGTDGKITVKKSSFYLFFASVDFDASATGDRTLQVFVNANVLPWKIVTARATSAGASIIEISVFITLSADDYITLRATQTSTGNLGIGSTANAKVHMVRLF